MNFVSMMSLIYYIRVSFKASLEQSLDAFLRRSKLITFSWTSYKPIRSSHLKQSSMQMIMLNNFRNFLRHATPFSIENVARPILMLRKALHQLHFKMEWWFFNWKKLIRWERVAYTGWYSGITQFLRINLAECLETECKMKTKVYENMFQLIGH